MAKSIPLSKFKANPGNPRLIKDDSFKKLVASIKGFPEMMEKRGLVCVTDPADGKFYPLGGNQRLRAIQELGYKEIPETWLQLADDWTEEQRREFIIRDNVSSGEWEWEALANQFEVIELSEFGLEVPGVELEVDYSAKNQEIDTDALNTDMVIKLRFSEADYWKVKQQLSEIAETPEKAVWKLLGNE